MRSTFAQNKKDKKITMMLHNLQTTMTHTTKQKNRKQLKEHQKDMVVPSLNIQTNKMCIVMSTSNNKTT